MKETKCMCVHALILGHTHYDFVLQKVVRAPSKYLTCNDR